MHFLQSSQCKLKELSPMAKPDIQSIVVFHNPSKSRGRGFESTSGRNFLLVLFDIFYQFFLKFLVLFVDFYITNIF